MSEGPPTPPKDDKDLFKKPYPPGTKKRAAPQKTVKTPATSGTQFVMAPFNFAQFGQSGKKRRKLPPGLPIEIILSGLRHYEYNQMYPKIADSQPGPSNRVVPSYQSDSVVYPEDENVSDEGNTEEEPYASSEEDVDSDGDIDDEVKAVVEELERKLKQQKLKSVVLKMDPSMPNSTVGGPIPNDVVNKESATAKIKKVATKYIYQLYRNEPFTLFGLDPSTFVTVGSRAAVEIDDDVKYHPMMEELMINLNNAKHGDKIYMYNKHFVLVRKLVPINSPPFKLFVRALPRDFTTEPPIVAEIIDNMSSLSPGARHPKAHKWPANMEYYFVEYCEDRFWNERTVPIPAGVGFPKRDGTEVKFYFSQTEDDSGPDEGGLVKQIEDSLGYEAAPPLDPNYIPTAGAYPIAAFDDAIQFRKAQRKENENSRRRAENNNRTSKKNGHDNEPHRAV